jgi:hypothetical protein
LNDERNRKHSNRPDGESAQSWTKRRKRHSKLYRKIK